jgi:hypothetical protein
VLLKTQTARRIFQRDGGIEFALIHHTEFADLSRLILPFAHERSKACALLWRSVETLFI